MVFAYENDGEFPAFLARFFEYVSPAFPGYSFTFSFTGC